MREVTTMTEEEWIAEGERRFGQERTQWRFVCPNCGHVQTLADCQAGGVESPETKIGFSCIGRWTGGKGTMSNQPCAPCDYTNGGLFGIYPLVVVTSEGKPYRLFDFAKEG